MHNPHIAEYTLHGKKLTSVANAKYFFGSKFTFNHHVNSVCQKASNSYVEICNAINKKLDTWITNLKLCCYSLVSTYTVSAT